MTTTPVTLIKGDELSFPTDYRDALPVNMYAVKKNILGAAGYMYQYPGITEFSEGLTGQPPAFNYDRGGVYNEKFKNHFRVNQEKLISIDAFGNVAELGDVSGRFQATMKNFYSFNTQGILADGSFYLYDPIGGFRQVTDPDLGNPIDGVWVDGYYFMTDGTWLFHTDVNDESAISPLKFATAEFSPDPTLGIGKTVDNKVIAFGRYSIEYFRNVATANFAFQREDRRAQKIGIVATHAKCEVNGIYYFTGGPKESSLGVYRLEIGNSIKISTRGIDRVLEDYTESELIDMRMEGWSEKDSTFLILHLPGKTLCFNITIAQSMGIENAWMILCSCLQDNKPYRVINGIFDERISRWLYGDKVSPKIGQIDDTVSTQFGEINEWILYSPLMYLDRASVDEIEIETIPGFTVYDDAKIAISATYNGVTWGQERWLIYGDPADYGQRFILRRLGYIRDKVGYKFRGASRSRLATGLLKITFN